MQSALIQIPVVLKNRAKYEKTLLINSNKVKNFHADIADTTYTTLFYAPKEDRREKVVEFRVALTVAEVDALLREEPIEQVIPVYATTRQPKYHIKKSINRVEYINIDSWVWAWDNTDGLSCTAWIEEAAFKLVELQLAHTIDEIDARASTSASYSESGI